MLAPRIPFMKQVARLCEAVGADVRLGRRGIGSDRRSGPAFLFPGPGYGGSCFPKDVKALMRTSAERGVDLDILKAVESANETQKQILYAKLSRHLGDLNQRTIAVWGPAVKAETADGRESPSLVLMEALPCAVASVPRNAPPPRKPHAHHFGNPVTSAT